jgi:hypothetical protein
MVQVVAMVVTVPQLLFLSLEGLRAKFRDLAGLLGECEGEGGLGDRGRSVWRCESM